MSPWLCRMTFSFEDRTAISPGIFQKLHHQTSVQKLAQSTDDTQKHKNKMSATGFLRLGPMPFKGNSSGNDHSKTWSCFGKNNASTCHSYVLTHACYEDDRVHFIQTIPGMPRNCGTRSMSEEFCESWTIFLTVG